MRNKIEKTHAKEKIITRTKQYLCGSVICLHPRSCKDFTIIKEKSTKCGSTVFFFSLSQRLHQETLITKTTVSISYIQDSQLATKRAYRPKPLLHELNLRKSPIKKPHNIISGRVVIRIKHN